MDFMKIMGGLFPMKIETKEVILLLNNMAETVAMDFLEKPRRHGGRIYGKCFGECSVNISTSKIGQVGFWNGQKDSGIGGSLIDLIMIANGMSFSEAIRYAKSHYLGIEDRPFTDEEKREWAKRQDAHKQRTAEREAVAEKKREKKIETVKSIWQKAVAIKGTLAEAYLTRRICHHDWPASLKFHGNILCEIDKKRYPALIAGVQAKDRKLISIWRIFLNADATNLKINDQKVKMGLGPSAGGLVILSPVGDRMNVGEGLESTLGAMAFSRFKGSWASSLSTSGMRGFDPLDGVNHYTFWRDGDYSRFEGDRIQASPGKSAGQQKQNDLSLAGISSDFMDPPEGMDWQDVWENSRHDN